MQLLSNIDEFNGQFISIKVVIEQFIQSNGAITTSLKQFESQWSVNDIYNLFVNNI